MGLHLCFILYFSFKCRNSHRLIAKVRIIDSNNINGGQKAKIRCKCLAVSSGLEIASLLYSISEQCCSHRLWLEGFHQASPSSLPHQISQYFSWYQISPWIISPFLSLPQVFLSVCCSPDLGTNILFTKRAPSRDVVLPQDMHGFLVHSTKEQGDNYGGFLIWIIHLEKSTPRKSSCMNRRLARRKLKKGSLTRL